LKKNSNNAQLAAKRCCGMPIILLENLALMMASLPVAKDVRRKRDKEDNMIFNKDKDEEIFLHRLVHLTPEEFIALAKYLGVKMSNVDVETGDYKIRDAEEITVDLVKAFRHCNHKERKSILKVMNK
jgi:hypothetical protein